jgi:YfiH family protein
MIISPDIFKSFSEISAGQSTRLGGVGKAPYSSLNLGKSVGDDLENVEKNRDIFFEKLGFSSNNVVFSYQIHGSEILMANKPGNYTGFDSQITNSKGICLAVSIADCTPILIYDAKNRAIAAIHAGWKGTVNEIVSKSLEAMNLNFGTIGEECYAFIGACISQTNFEVGEEVAVNFPLEFKYFNQAKNKYFVDLKAANKAQLLNFGIPNNQIEVSDYCTVSDNDLFFSHRKEQGITGRMMAAIGLKE